jgi:hypothetical protein
MSEPTFTPPTKAKPTLSTIEILAILILSDIPRFLGQEVAESKFGMPHWAAFSFGIVLGLSTVIVYCVLRRGFLSK